jgi:hypothetical protein
MRPREKTGRDAWACRLVGGSQNPHEANTADPAHPVNRVLRHVHRRHAEVSAASLTCGKGVLKKFTILPRQKIPDRIGHGKTIALPRRLPYQFSRSVQIA